MLLTTRENMNDIDYKIEEKHVNTRIDDDERVFMDMITEFRVFQLFLDSKEKCYKFETG